MKLSEKIAELQKALEEHGDLECIVASDEEGNAFHPAGLGGHLYIEECDELPYDLDISVDNDYYHYSMMVYCLN